MASTTTSYYSISLLWSKFRCWSSSLFVEGRIIIAMESYRIIDGWMDWLVDYHTFDCLLFNVTHDLDLFLSYFGLIMRGVCFFIFNRLVYCMDGVLLCAVMCCYVGVLVDKSLISFWFHSGTYIYSLLTCLLALMLACLLVLCSVVWKSIDWIVMLNVIRRNWVEWVCC